MRILIFGSSFPVIGGIERFLEGYCPALIERGHVLAGVGHGAAARYREELGYPLWSFPLRVEKTPEPEELLQFMRLRRRVCGVIAAFQPDVIHFHPSAFEIMVVDYVMRRLDLPLVTTLHSDFSGPRLAREGSTASRIFERSARLSCVSDYLAGATLEKAPALGRRLTVIRNALPASGRPAADYPSAKRLLALGRLIDDKGFDLAVAAMPRILERHPEARLTIAGNGPAREPMTAQAAALGVGHAVTLSDWIPPEQVPAAMAGADAVLMPSRWQEPFGLVALEAAHAARPCVATAVGGLPEIVQDGVTGRLAAPGDPAAIAEAVLDILDDPAAAAEMGTRARARALAEFDFAAMVDAYENLLRSAIGTAAAD